MRKVLLLATSIAAIASCAREDATTPPLFGAGPAGSTPQAAPAPQAAPQVARVAPSSPVVGVWEGMVRDRSRRGAQMQNWRLQLNPDGTYRSITQFAQGGTIQHWGRYVVGDGFIRMQLMGWEPRQECGPSGCFPLDMPDTDTVVVTAVSPQQIMTEQGALARVQ